MQNLGGKVALVTGGGRGIGAAIAAKLASAGAQVVICGRTQEPLDQTASQVGRNVMPIVADVSSWDSVRALAERVEREYGKLDILVNNAGVGSFSAPLHELELEEWERVMQINLRGVFYCMRAFVPLMGSGAHIVNISSLAGKNPLPNGAVYAASKWGLNGLTYSVAEELRGRGIRVSVVCPGSVDTELSPHEGKSKSKMLQGDDVAHAVLAIVTQEPQSFISEVLIRPTQKP
jgi:NAD(P)-dependent dehydrogenase (short-subunit alcohol dehydrogenase family)